VTHTPQEDRIFRKGYLGDFPCENEINQIHKCFELSTNTGCGSMTGIPCVAMNPSPCENKPLDQYNTKSKNLTMHSSANFGASPISVVFYCSCDKVYHRQ